MQHAAIAGGDNASNKGLEGDANISANQEGGTLRPDGGTLTDAMTQADALILTDAMAEADSATERDSKTTQTTDGSAVVVTGEKVVTYDARQGVFTGPASVKVKDGETVSKPTAPTRPTYVFTGWYTEESEAKQNETTRFKFKDEAGVTPSSVTSDITLYAGWVPLTLEGVVKLGKLPSDLSLYDEVTQAALGAYKAEATAGASVSAIFMTEKGGSDPSKRDGTSWETAWAGSQLKEKLDGINDASPSHVYLFLVAAGEYRADTGFIGTSDKPGWLAMKDEVAIVGGWDGTGGGGSWRRGPSYVTNFKGSKKEEKLFSVFYNKNLTDKATLAYATVSDGSAIVGGGGMHNKDSSPVLMNVTFSGNLAIGGGGMHNFISSSPVLTNVTFWSNRVNYQGGGMYNDNNGGKGPTVVNSIFWGNEVKEQTQGSQIYLSNDKGRGSENINLYNCIIEGGLGVSNSASTPLPNPLTLTDLSKLTDQSRFGGIGVYKTKEAEGDPVTITYAEVYGADTKEDPKLEALAQNGGSVPTTALGAESSAIDKGVYIMQKGGDFYYSETGASSGAAWYLNTHPSLAASSLPPVSAVALPAGAPINIDLTAKDARGYRRVGKPDIGAYEFGGVAP